METIKNCRCSICTLLCNTRTIILFSLLSGFSAWAQDSIYEKKMQAVIESTRRYDSIAKPYYDSIRRGPFKTRYGFSLSPIARNVETVNGLTLGIGHFRSELIPMQTVNGINAEISPVGLGMLLVWPFLDFRHTTFDDLFETDSTCTVINGLNVSTGGFLEGGEVRGVNISTFTKMNKMNGLSVSAGFLISKRANGVSVAGLYNAAAKRNGLSIALVNTDLKTNGLQIGLMNYAGQLKGAQIGFVNVSPEKAAGLQIGLVNHSKSKCFQLGLLNINGKRALPIINW
ncbi:hypothetical protein FLLO111716_11625 [Flavobacterium longum]|uniref:LA_2272 family surface repeat-containing protein n=1 Tax=Flavobacterium longum TaxID=1299340 RepID=UPI0039EC3566